jgi:hypothetical protein
MSSSHDISIKKYNVTNISLPHSLKKTSSFIFEAMKERPFKIARLRELNASEKSELLDVFEFFTGEEHRGILQKLSTDDIQENTLASAPKRLHERIILFFNDIIEFLSSTSIDLTLHIQLNICSITLSSKFESISLGSSMKNVSYSFLVHDL